MKSAASERSSAASIHGDIPLHRAIYEELLREIRGGLYKAGDRLPSEALLCSRFSASRITVAKAIQTLQRQNLVSRRPGSGTYVEAPAAAPTSLRFGLLIPELGSTEIFEPICQGMMQSPLGKSHSLIWGYSPARDEERESAAEQLCHQYIAQKISGVFFAPLEYTATRDVVNRRIISALAQAGMPVVLLDRCYEKYPARSPYDLVGIDNHRAAFVVTRHLQEHGAQRILFAARPNSASTVDERIAGYYHALRDRAGYTGSIWHVDVNDTIAVRSFVEAERPDAIVCANDLTAAQLMKALEQIGVTIPRQIRVVGIDDVNYAKFLPVPLTTVRQDCAEIGATAMSLMLARLERPNRSAREVLVHFDLVVRESCGAHLSSGPQTKPQSVHV